MILKEIIHTIQRGETVQEGGERLFSKLVMNNLTFTNTNKNII